MSDFREARTAPIQGWPVQTLRTSQHPRYVESTLSQPSAYLLKSSGSLTTLYLIVSDHRRRPPSQRTSARSPAPQPALTHAHRSAPPPFQARSRATGGGYVYRVRTLAGCRACRFFPVEISAGCPNFGILRFLEFFLRRNSLKGEVGGGRWSDSMEPVICTFRFFSAFVLEIKKHTRGLFFFFFFL